MSGPHDVVGRTDRSPTSPAEPNPAASDAAAACAAGSACAPRSRWVLAMFVAIALGLPIGWLLSHLALLPFYLGLFFFALFGLVVGAVQYRIGSAAAPISRSRAYLSGAVVVLVIWTVALQIEYVHLFGDATYFVKDSFRRRTPAQLQEIDRDTPLRIREQLARFGPIDGPPRYIRWAIESGELKFGLNDRGDEIDYRLSQGHIGFPIRLGLSLVLLSFGVLSQVAGLAAPAKRAAADDAGEATDAESAAGAESSHDAEQPRDADPPATADSSAADASLTNAPSPAGSGAAGSPKADAHASSPPGKASAGAHAARGPRA